MKRIFTALALAIATIGLVGCSAQSAQQFSQQITLHQANIQGGSNLATHLALLSVAPANREQARTDIHSIAVAAQQALNAQNPSIESANAIVLNLVVKSKSPYADLVATLFQASSGLVDAELQQIYANAPANAEQTAGLALLRSVVDGIVQGSAPLMTPTTAPTTQSSAELPIRRWRNGEYPVISFG